MNTKHKNYEWIVAFAEGKAVEYKGFGLDFAYDHWQEVTSLDVFNQHAMFRLKPEQRKTIGYRRYMYKNPYNGKHYVHMTHESYVGSGGSSDPEFLNSMDVEWIDIEWQYEIVPEGR